MTRNILLTLTAIALAASAAAHDFWIEPSAYRLAPGAPLKVGLRVGELFKGELVRRDNDHILRFAGIGPDAAEKPLIGLDGKDPAGYAKFDTTGLYYLAYNSRPSKLELPPERFNKYLKDEGLDAAAQLRIDRMQTDQPGHEQFIRSVKSLITVGPPADAGFDRVLGLPLEIIPLDNPLAAAPGDEVRVKVLFNGKPLASMRVTAMCQGDKEESQARTDQEGLARIKLTKPGVWLIAGVHMIEAPKDSDSDWESYWTSLTFELPK